MQMLYAGKIVPPCVEILVRCRNRIDIVFFDQGVHRASRAMYVEFFFEQSINGTVQGKRKPRWPADSKPAIDVKTARAFDEQINL
jgi:hypothetical protein